MASASIIEQNLTQTPTGRLIVRSELNRISPKACGLVSASIARFCCQSSDRKIRNRQSLRACVDLESDLRPCRASFNTDLAPIHTAAVAIKKEGILRRRCRLRPAQYLNNILEQDHRAIKRRVNAKQGFREFHAARRTLQGYEAMNMIRKGQVRWVSGNDVRSQIRFIGKLFWASRLRTRDQEAPTPVPARWQDCNTALCRSPRSTGR